MGVMTAGYSGSPLVKKLGIKPGFRLGLVSEPPGFRDLLVELPAGVEMQPQINNGDDLVLLFVTERAVLEARIEDAAHAVFPTRAIWVAWPKRVSKVPTDVTEDVVREVALPMGLVDNKVCAIDDTWSGLRLVWRKELRG